VADDEVRVISESGGEKGKKLARFDLLPVGPLTEVARLYGRGAAKYADRNWELGYDWGLSFAAMQRHAWAFWGGESIDPETQRHHLASVIFHAMALMEFEDQGKGVDSRSIESRGKARAAIAQCFICGSAPESIVHRRDYGDGRAFEHEFKA